MIVAPTRYDSRAAAGPMCTASSARRTWRAFASASEYTATVAMPIFRAVLMTRQAISPRLAINILVNMRGLRLRSGVWRHWRCAGSYDQYAGAPVPAYWSYEPAQRQ